MQNMNQAYQKNLNTDKNNISKTGYRALFLLLKLIESPKTRDEILACLKDDPIIKTEQSKDTVTNTINALKKAGCVISRPTQRTNNKYVLKSHPFMISFSKENIEALLSLRESIVTLNDWQLLVNLNTLYAKIAKYAPDLASKNMLFFNHPLKNINLAIVRELLLHAKLKKHTIITYDSPKYNEESLYFTPEYITLENGKLYVWGYSPKYNNISYLRIDRIKKVNLINFLGYNSEDAKFEKPNIEVKYKLKGLSAMMFIEDENEIIESETPDKEYSLTIKATINNEFNFLQKILSYGTDCLLISPKYFKEKLFEKIKAIKMEYQDDRRS